MNDWRSLLVRIGGPNALSWPQFWLLFAVNAVVSLASNPGTFQGEFAPRLGLLALSQIALFSAPLLVWRRWVRRGDRSRPGLMLAAFVAGGLLRALVVIWGNWLLAGGALTVSEVVFRLNASVSIMTVSFVIGAISRDLTREYAQTAAELNRVQADVANVEEDVFGRMRANHAAVIERIRGQLERLLTLPDPSAMVSELRVSVDDIVRPLSHDLARSIPNRPETEPSTDPVGIPWRSLIREAGQIDLFLPTSTVLVSFMTSVSWLLARFDRLDDQLLMFGMLCLSWLLMWGANLLWRRMRLVSVPAVLVWGTLFGVTIGAVWALPFVVVRPDLRPMLAVSIGYYLIAAWLFSLPRAADRLARQHSGDVAVAIAQLEWELARTQASAWQQQRNFAYALHGPVQSAITASMFRLEGALAAGEVSAALRSNVERDLRGTLEALAMPQGGEVDFAEVVSEIRQLWDGIAEVSVSYGPGTRELVDHDSTAAAVLSDLTREACSNAVRHGRARTVTVLLRVAAENLIELVIANDGADLPEGAGTGLGTQLLTEATVSWSRVRRDQLTILTALVPVATPEYVI